MKFAFIAHYEGLQDEYTAICDKGANYNQFYGVDSIKSGKELVIKLEQDGYGLINLCGDFDADITADIAASTKGNVKICYADYFPEELAKLDALENFDEYGVIVIDEGLSETAAYDIKSAAGNTSVRFVKDVGAACNAAQELAAGGSSFIELCSWFDTDRTKAVIHALDGQIPVGSCGI